MKGPKFLYNMSLASSSRADCDLEAQRTEAELEAKDDCCDDKRNA